MIVSDLMSILSRFSPGQQVKIITNSGIHTVTDVATSAGYNYILIIGDMKAE